MACDSVRAPTVTAIRKFQRKCVPFNSREYMQLNILCIEQTMNSEKQMAYMVSVHSRLRTRFLETG